MLASSVSIRARLRLFAASASVPICDAFPKRAQRSNEPCGNSSSRSRTRALSELSPNGALGVKAIQAGVYRPSMWTSPSNACVAARLALHHG
jgi:hypothetical protein